MALVSIWNQGCRTNMPLIQISKFLITIVFLGFAIGAYSVDPLKPNLSTANAAHLSLSLNVGKSHIFKLKDPVTRVSIADPNVADVMLVSFKELYLLGKKSGTTNVFLWHEGEKMTVVDLTVNTDISSVQTLLNQLMPTEKRLRVIAAGDSLVLTGQLSDAMKVAQAVQIAENVSGKKVMNMTTLDHLPQVLIEVKIAEIDKVVADQLGLEVSGKNFAFSAMGVGSLGSGAQFIGSSGTNNAWLQAQINSGLIKILAEPNIMAISGQEGQFLAGGMVFLPVPQTSATGGGAVITLQQQNYGVGVKFTPTVLDGNRINLKVRPEVSEVNPQGITVNAGGSTMVMPAITTREASTTVQLYDGQTFAIGGLISNNVSESINAFPGLSNLPIIGALFRSSSFQSHRTELLILVTPHIVKPQDGRPELPTDKFIQPTEAEFLIGGKLEGEKKPFTPIVSKEAGN